MQLCRLWSEEVCFSVLPSPLPVSDWKLMETFSLSMNRTAIEEELEVLYDAYYDELESYANHQVRYASSGYTIAPPPGPGPFPGSVDVAALPSVAPITKEKKPTGIVKTTRDHKNVRPAAKKKSNNSPMTQTGTGNPPRGHAHDGNNANGPAHGEPGHTHSPSCPHHPHNHSTTNSNNSHAGHNHGNNPPTTAAKAKGAQVESENYDDEEEDDAEEGEDEEEEEYDEDEYDEEDEEEEVSFLVWVF